MNQIPCGHASVYVNGCPHCELKRHAFHFSRWGLGPDAMTEPAGGPVVLTNHLSPGDVTVMTAAVACLHEQRPGMYRTWYAGTAESLWDHNPHILTGDPPPDCRVIPVEYPLVNRSNQEPIHFLSAYVDGLSRALGVPLRLTRTRPALYLSDEEKAWRPQVYEEESILPARYWVLNAGTKDDFTAKWWGAANYRWLVAKLRGRVRFVQVGESGHNHPYIDGTIDLRGKTNTREFVRLVYHAAGGVGPTTFLQHVAAAFQKPYVCILGGREPVSWVQYPQQTTLHTIGALACCETEACWRSRVVPLGDGDKSDQSLCVLPTPGPDPIPTCMALIGVDEVANAVMRYTTGVSLV